MRASRAAKRRAGRERGSQLIETALILLPLLALMFLGLDAAWAVFVKATLEFAVREGVRYGITGQTSTGIGQIASIEAVVQQNALGLLSGNQAGTLSVTFLNPATLGPTSSNLGGNLVRVAVTNYQLSPMAPLLRSSAPLSISVQSIDMIEPSPGGVAPAP